MPGPGADLTKQESAPGLWNSGAGAAAQNSGGSATLNVRQ